MTTIVWMLFLGIMLVVVWYARLHPARGENWTLTWKNALGRAFLLTLTLGALYLYNQLSAQLLLPLRRRGTPPISPRSSGTPVDGQRVGSVSKNPTTVRGFFLEQRGSVVVGLALILCVVLDLLTHVPQQNPAISRQVFEPGLMRLSPQPRHGDGRAMISPSDNLKLYRFTTTNAFNDYINNRRLMFANCNLLDAIPKVNGFYSLYIRDADAVRAFLYDSTNNPPGPLCDFLGVSQITDPENFLEWKYRPDYLPLASMGQKPLFTDGLTTFNAITSQAFNPRSTVYLPLEARSFAEAAFSRNPTPDSSQQPSRRSGALARREGGEGDFGSKSGMEHERTTQSTPPTASHLEPKILAASFSAHRGEIQITASEPTWLVIAQTNSHSWRAYSDGTPLRIWQANYAFQAALVPAGKHLVQLVYRDRGFAAGTALSILSLIGCIAAARFRDSA